MDYHDIANTSLKNNSTQLVLNVVRRNYPISRQEIARLTDLSVASVSRILTKLFEDGYVEEMDSASGGLGRKTKLITLKDRCVLTAGVEFDGEEIKIAIIDEKGHIVAFELIDARGLDKSPDVVAKEIYGQARLIFEKAGIPLSKLYGIGVSLPGIIAFEEGRVDFSAQLGWRNAPLKAMMEEISGVGCVVDNDIKSAAYAEYNRGSAKDSKIAALIYYGSGLGSAVIIDGKILRGVTNSAGELGHITQDINGIMCNCGKIGCLQTNIAKCFILEEAKKVASINHMEQLFLPETRRKKSIERIVQKFIANAAIAVDTAVCAYNPDTVILCGDIIGGKNSIFDEICAVYYNNFMCDYLKDSFTIKKSGFNGKASLTGVGMQAAEKFFQSV